MEAKQSALKASTVSVEAAAIVKFLEAKGYKTQEINMICLSASKIAESIVIVQMQTASLAQIVANTLNNK